MDFVAEETWFSALEAPKGHICCFVEAFKINDTLESACKFCYLGLLNNVAGTGLVDFVVLSAQGAVCFETIVFSFESAFTTKATVVRLVVGIGIHVVLNDVATSCC